MDRYVVLKKKNGELLDNVIISTSTDTVLGYIDGKPSTLTEILNEIFKNIDDLSGVTESEGVRQLPTKANFPSVGAPNALYIDKSTGKGYRWDDTTMVYEVVGFDPDSIEYINAGEIAAQK